MNITTRDFLKLSTASAFAGAGWCGQAAAKAPKVRLAAIGTGGRGHTDLHAFLRSGLAEIVCAADVYAPSLDWVRKEQPKAKIYADYRKMLRECAGTYDAVSIMTPDHLHCAMFLEAAKYNVPVYCAKPLGHTVAEVMTMMRVAREKKLITHVSHHGNSEPGTQLLREWMESGIFGQPLEAHVYENYGVNLFESDMRNLVTPEPMMKGLDWELWQGPVKHRPFFKGVVPRKWRAWSMYGEGIIGDWCCHLLGPLSTALDLGLPVAVTMVESDFDPVKKPFGFPTSAHYKLEYAAKGARGPFTIHWYEGYKMPPRPLGLEPDQAFDPVKEQTAGGWLRCEKATMMFGQTGASSLRVVPHSQMKVFKPLLPPKKYPRTKNHWAEFLLAVQQRRAANTPFALGGRLTLAGLMGSISTRFPGRRLQFDPLTMQCTNVPEANNFLRQPDWNADAIAEFGLPECRM